jgi:hypothetical protein
MNKIGFEMPVPGVDSRTVRTVALSQPVRTHLNLAGNLVICVNLRYLRIKAFTPLDPAFPFVLYSSYKGHDGESTRAEAARERGSWTESPLRRSPAEVPSRAGK